MSISPLTITGVSQFSSDFQTILNRAVKIAQIPVTFLQNKDSDLLQQKSLLSGLSSSTGALVASLQSLGDVAANQALAASSSDPAKVSASGGRVPDSLGERQESR